MSQADGLTSHGHGEDQVRFLKIRVRIAAAMGGFTYTVSRDLCHLTNRCHCLNFTNEVAEMQREDVKCAEGQLQNLQGSGKTEV